MTGMCIVPRDFERTEACSAPAFDLATSKVLGLVPGDEPQGMTSPAPSWDVRGIEAPLVELAATLIAAEL
jgi:hypothetical protein